MSAIFPSTPLPADDIDFTFAVVAYGMAATISDDLAAELTVLQRRIVNENQQVLVIFEGRSGRVMGRVINEFMNLLEPRGITYTHFVPEEMSSPRDMLRYITREPAKGKISIYDRSWYSRIVAEVNEGRDADELQNLAMSLERYFSNNGVIIVKIFLNISDETMDEVAQRLGKKRLKSSSFLTDDHIDPKKWRDKIVMPMIASTNTPFAPWDIVDVQDLDMCMAMVVHTFMERVVHRLEHEVHLPPKTVESRYPNPRKEADLTKTAKSYKSELEELSADIARLQLKLAESGRSMVLVFEGWDAAGKGGNIKRLASALDPRGYEVLPIAAPTKDELARHYLWRFWTRLPKTGHIAIFDRSWYGRVMVERLEGFCTTDDWQRAYDEINEFEQELNNCGMVVIKFWVQIDKDTQLARFNERQADPAKQWKITEEDWRNREKWDAYQKAVDEMLQKTSTQNAPWHILESVDKRYARIKAMKLVIHAIEQAL